TGAYPCASVGASSPSLELYLMGRCCWTLIRHHGQLHAAGVSPHGSSHVDHHRVRAHRYRYLFNRCAPGMAVAGVAIRNHYPPSGPQTWSHRCQTSLGGVTFLGFAVHTSNATPAAAWNRGPAPDELSRTNLGIA